MTERQQGAVAAFAAAALVTLVGATACSSSASGNRDAARSPSLATGGVPCSSAAAAHTATLPATFPKTFPLPPHSVVYSVDDRGSGGIVVSAVTPASFEQTLHALQQGLPAAGFTAEHGEVEADDAESDWTSASYQGRWAIRALDRCGDETAISVVARPLG